MCNVFVRGDLHPVFNDSRECKSSVVPFLSNKTRRNFSATFIAPAVKMIDLGFKGKTSLWDKFLGNNFVPYLDLAQ